MSTVARPPRNYVDFADDNLGPRYTSFETNQQFKNQQQRNYLASMTAAQTFGVIGTRSIDISLANSASPKPKRNNKSKDDSANVDLTLKPQSNPSDLPVYSLTLDPSKLVCFYGRDHFLSNYFTAPMTVNGVAYRTVEHYYEACKLFSFGGFQWSSQLNVVKDAGAAKVTSKRLMQFVDRRRVEAWKRSEGLAVIENALTHKFSQHSDLAAKLLATGDSFLAHCNPYDTLWGTGLNEEKVKQWATLNQGATLKIARDINIKTLQHCPTTYLGQNALGYLLMQVRQALQAKLRKLEQSGLSDDDSGALTPASKTPIGPPSGIKSVSSDSTASVSGGGGKLSPTVGAKESPPPSAAVAAASASALMHSSNDSMENVRKICEQLAQINVQKAAAAGAAAGLQ